MNRDKEMKIVIIQIDNFINKSGNKKNNEDNDNYQKQQLISKQRDIQAQELVLLINNFGRALTSLECYANRYSEKEL